MINIATLDIAKTHEGLVSKKFSVKELIDSYLKNIKERNPRINAYIEIYNDIDEQIADAQKKIDEGKATVLTGIPIAIKDNILIKGKKVSASSKVLEGYVAPYDATVIEKLRKESPIFIGRTNMDEFAMGSSTETSVYGITRNPHDEGRVPGGSSGGSAAAVSMNGALIALGSDTGGSIRQPASFNGLVGLKPTYGRISRYGLMAMASSLDQIGPITKTVNDAEILFNALAGTDLLDSTTVLPKVISTDKKNTIGVPFSILEKGVDVDVLKNFKESVTLLEKAGYTIVDITLPNIDYALSLYYVIQPAEVSSNMARFDGVKYGLHVDGGSVIEDYFVTRRAGFGKEVRRRIMLGTYVLSSGYYDAYYGKAQKVREIMTKDFATIFEKVDVILTPTTPSPAFKIGEKTGDPLAMYLEDIFTVSANIVRVPAISLPSGFVEREGKQLPLGIQFMAPHFREDILFDIGKKFEYQKNK